MKKIASILALAAAVMPMAAKSPSEVTSGLKVGSADISRDGSNLAIDFDLDLKKFDVGSDRAVILTPVYKHGEDSVELNSVGIYGRRRYYHYLRRDGGTPISGPLESLYRSSQRPDSVVFDEFIPYTDWMNRGELYLIQRDYGCCHKLIAEKIYPLGKFRQLDPIKFNPAWLVVEGDTVKEGHIDGKAMIQFVVDRYNIEPNKFNNPAELGKIINSIKPLQEDNDITIKTVWLKGYASPESPYAHNTFLAKNRVKAVSDYVKNLYNFPDNVMVTEYEPEDWEGLREFVEKSDLDNKQAIIELIDTPMDPDAREALLRKRFPAQFQYLYKVAYPPLRHTDYRIDYTVKKFIDPEELLRVYHTQPSKLSPNEFYILGQQFEPGSEAFVNIYETCAAMYPDNEAANLNAAVAALSNEDYNRADRYLPKAGNSAEAIYTRGMSKLINAKCTLAEAKAGELSPSCVDNVREAYKLLNQAKEMGLKQADDALAQLLDYADYYGIKL